MDTYTIESSDEKFYAKNNGPFGFIFNLFGSQKAKKRKSLTIRDLHSILTDPNNEDLQNKLKITNNKQQSILYETNKDGCDIILETGNKKEAFRFHKDGSMDKLIEIKYDNGSSYILEKYDSKGQKEIEKPLWGVGDDFKTILSNNILGHKRKFNLGEDYQIEKDFRSIDIVTNKNAIDFFDLDAATTYEEIMDASCKKFGYNSYKELLDKAEKDKELYRLLNNFEKAFLLTKRVEFLKKIVQVLREPT